MQSVGWPDMGVPVKADYTYLLELIKEMKKIKDKHPAMPIVVHCSAGIGRTGTLIALFFLTSLIDYQVKNKHTIRASVFGTVRALREQRYGAVQTFEQYEFIYDFIALYLSGKLK